MGLTSGGGRKDSGMYEAVGKIKLINETQSFPSGFSKREFVVTTGNDKYPQDLKFEVVKDKCAMLDSFETGQDVQVSFDIRGNEYNGKYYVNLSCWKIQASDGAAEPSRTTKPAAQGQRSANAEPATGDLRNEDDFDDDVPF
jgi:single-stranded DNA-binding protein